MDVFHENISIPPKKSFNDRHTVSTTAPDLHPGDVKASALGGNSLLAGLSSPVAFAVMATEPLTVVW